MLRLFSYMSLMTSRLFLVLYVETGATCSVINNFEIMGMDLRWKYFGGRRGGAGVWMTGGRYLQL